MSGQKRCDGGKSPVMAVFFEKGEPISDELLKELARQGKLVKPEDVAYLRSVGARYIRSRESFVFS